MLSCINIHKIKHWVIDDYLYNVIRSLGKPMLDCMLSRIGRHKIMHWVIDDYLFDIRSLGKPTLDINALIVIMLIIFCCNINNCSYERRIQKVTSLHV
jgi:hypothetical protein